MSLPVDILPSHEINSKKWNTCVATFGNGLIYSRYEYLNLMCNNWHGVIVGDYEAVIALPWRRKFGIRYYYEPAFIQQLGLIGNSGNFDITQLLFSFARYGDILFNFCNEQIANKVNAQRRTNLVIDLSVDLKQIRSAYKKDLVQNLRKAEKANLIVSTDLAISEAVEQYRETYQKRLKHITSNDYANFLILAQQLSTRGMCFTRKIVNSSGELMTIGLFFKDEKRIYNIMNTTTEKGRSVEANHKLIDFVIEEFVGKQLLFDFEGSDLPGVKSFYEKFGAVDQPYYHWHFNKLPLPLRLLKR